MLAEAGKKKPKKGEKGEEEEKKEYDVLIS